MSLALDKPGNVLPMDGQLLAVDDQEIHTYLVWDVADRMLRRRMEEEVDDPTPAITYAELSYRAGRPDGILPAVDRALARPRPAGASLDLAGAPRSAEIVASWISERTG